MVDAPESLIVVLGKPGDCVTMALKLEIKPQRYWYPRQLQSASAGNRAATV